MIHKILEFLRGLREDKSSERNEAVKASLDSTYIESIPAKRRKVLQKVKNPQGFQGKVLFLI
jgi:hypothetical protein